MAQRKGIISILGQALNHRELMTPEFQHRVIFSITLPRTLLLKGFIIHYIVTALLEALAIYRINDYLWHVRILCLVLANFMRIKSSGIEYQFSR